MGGQLVVLSRVIRVSLMDNLDLKKSWKGMRTFPKQIPG